MNSLHENMNTAESDEQRDKIQKKINGAQEGIDKR